MKNYIKKTLQPMDEWTPDYDMTGVSVWGGDTPEVGGMVATNPKDTSDRWYVAKQFFQDNYIPAPDSFEIVVHHSGAGIMMDNNLKAIRKSAGLTMQELGDMACLSKPHICDLEKGRHSPALTTAYALAAALGCTVYDIWPDARSE